jgi:endonuclease/exonuclease/phosphatase family metal-dependent hydrolase
LPVRCPWMRSGDISSRSCEAQSGGSSGENFHLATIRNTCLISHPDSFPCFRAGVAEYLFKHRSLDSDYWVKTGSRQDVPAPFILKKIERDCIMDSTSQVNEPHRDSKLRLLSYNIQVGIAAAGYRDYIFHGWKHILPHRDRNINLHRIARMIAKFDMVGLLELDSGSLRSGYLNHAEYLAKEGRFPHWYDKVNRSWWSIARHSMGFLSRYEPIEVTRYSLPSRMPGRSALKICYGNRDNPLVLVLVHLSLSRNARLHQMEFVSEIVRGYNHVILMGDMNCSSESRELAMLLGDTKLCMPSSNLYTYPSWNPKRHIDHILVSPSIRINSVEVLNYPLSDHLPISMDVTLPDNVLLPTGGRYVTRKAA